MSTKKPDVLFSPDQLPPDFKKAFFEQTRIFPWSSRVKGWRAEKSNRLIFVYYTFRTYGREKIKKTMISESQAQKMHSVTWTDLKESNRKLKKRARDQLYKKYAFSRSLD